MPNTSAMNLGGNATGFNIPGAQDMNPNMPLSAMSASPHMVGASSSPTTVPVVPFTAFGSGQVSVPGAAPNNPYGGPAYTATTDPNLIGQLTSAFGEGAGDSLYNFLQSGAGFNPAIIQQMLDMFQPQIAQGSANIMSEFGAAGMGDSSSAGIAEGSLQAQMADAENSLIAQLYEQGSQNYMDLLEGITGVGGGATNVGQKQGTTAGTVNSIIGDLSTGATALSTAGIGGTSGTLATILSILGGL